MSRKQINIGRVKGSMWYTGTNPSEVEKPLEGDLYLDKVTFKIYVYENKRWNLAINLTEYFTTDILLSEGNTIGAEVIDIATSETYDEASEKQVPTSKAISDYIKKLRYETIIKEVRVITSLEKIYDSLTALQKVTDQEEGTIFVCKTNKKLPYVLYRWDATEQIWVYVDDVREGTIYYLLKDSSNFKAYTVLCFDGSNFKQLSSNDEEIKKLIPKKLSELSNDSGFITNTVSNLTNYYLKEETYTKDEVHEIINNISTMNMQVVSALPTSNISNTTIYLVPLASSKQNNVYEEWIYVNSNWELIGTTQIDLSNYVQTEQVMEIIEENSEEVDVLLVGTSKNYDIESDEQVPTTKAVKQILGSGGVPTGIEITYAELKTLRDNSQLVPGTNYIITDYQCTTTTIGTESGNHQFDIIVVADSANVLNENARARKHEGDEYFVNSNIAAWELKYSLDNDSSEFDWADEENGKGVIYYMKDEWNNEVPYDFKNIIYLFGPVITCEIDGETYKFARNYNPSYKKNYNNITYNCFYEINERLVKAISDNKIYLKDGDITLNSIVYKNTYPFNGTQLTNVAITKVDNISKNYTFNTNLYFSDNEEGTEKNNGNFINNVIKIYKPYNDKCYLNNNVLNDGCGNNLFEENCKDNSLGFSCYYNVFARNCYNNDLGARIGEDGDFADNCFGYGCHHNVLRGVNWHNKFGSACSYNIFGTESNYNELFESASSNKLGDYCYNNKIYVCDGTIELKDDVSNLEIKRSVQMDLIITERFADPAIVTIEADNNGKVIAHWLNEDLTRSGKYTEDGIEWLDL